MPPIRGAGVSAEVYITDLVRQGISEDEAGRSYEFLQITLQHLDENQARRASRDQIDITVQTVKRLALDHVFREGIPQNIQIINIYPKEDFSFWRLVKTSVVTVGSGALATTLVAASPALGASCGLGYLGYKGIKRLRKNK